jgi:hypothetical protein
MPRHHRTTPQSDQIADVPVRGAIDAVAHSEPACLVWRSTGRPLDVGTGCSRLVTTRATVESWQVPAAERERRWRQGENVHGYWINWWLRR